jgi:hypothetical protein
VSGEEVDWRDEIATALVALWCADDANFAETAQVQIEAIDAADALVALPAVQRLIAAEAKVQRVEALITKWRDGRLPDQGRAFDLRRALDGQP